MNVPVHAAILALVLLSAPAAAVELRVDEAWIRHLPPTVPVRAGYLTLFNPLARPVRIVAARSADFAAVEFHRSVMRDGSMSMQQLLELEVDPGTTLRLEPGGLHLMLMQPVAPGKTGETRRITLEYDDGSGQVVESRLGGDTGTQRRDGDEVVAAAVADLGQCVVLHEDADGRPLARTRGHTPEGGVDPAAAPFDLEPVSVE